MLGTTTEAGGRAGLRLREEEVAWMTTVPNDGRSQSVPVWFLWDGEWLLIYSREGSEAEEHRPQPAHRDHPQLQRDRRRRGARRGDGGDSRRRAARRPG